MTIVGFNFRKIIAEREGPVEGKLDINNSITIVDVKEQDLSLGDAKQKALGFEFEFTSKVEPKIGHLSFTGEVLYVGTSAQHKEILAEWKKSKKVLDEVMNKLVSTILHRCNIQGLILSKEVGMPPPIPLPKLQQQ